jgi:hypothetical protein
MLDVNAMQHREAAVRDALSALDGPDEPMGFSSNEYDLEVLQMGERPGFKQYVSANKEALRCLAALRDEHQVIQHLSRHLVLLEGIAHARAWFFDRHVAASKSSRADLFAQIQDEAAAFFLLDAAADAARAAFETSNDIQAAAAAGVSMLARGLEAAGDPVGIRARLGERVPAWLDLCKRGAAAQKKQLQAKSRKNAAQRRSLNATASNTAAALSAEPEPEPLGTATLQSKVRAPATPTPTAVVPTPVLVSAVLATGEGPVHEGEEGSRADEPKPVEESGFAGLLKAWWG